MSSTLGAIYALSSALLFVALCLQGRLTARVLALFSQTPLIYSQLPLPAGVDLRSVLENPRLFYFSLAATGTVLRILLGTVLFLGLDVWAGEQPPLVKALVVLVALVGAEVVSRLFGPEPGARIGRVAAFVMRMIGGGVRLFPAAKRGAHPDALGGTVVATVDGQEVFDPVAKRFLGGFLRLKRMTVQQVMIPRERMVTLNEDWSVTRAARAARAGGRTYARIPVVGRDGEIKGLVHTKDLLLLVHSSQGGAFVKGIIREVDYAPTTQRLDSLLRQFQTRRVHLAVTRDEYGAAVGLITMDDILRAALSGGAEP